MIRRAISAALLTLLLASSAPAAAQEASAPLYEPALLRLSELLGSIHYLRELCEQGLRERYADDPERLIDGQLSDEVMARLDRETVQAGPWQPAGAAP